MSLTSTSQSLASLSKPEKKVRYLIGIDPGRHTGVAVYDRQQKCLIGLYSLDFWKLISFVQNFKENFGKPADGLPFTPSEPVEFEVVIEDPNEIKAMYKDRLHGKEALSALTMAQSVGRNKEQAFLLIEYFTMRQIKHRTVKPRNKKSGGGKWTHDTFVQYTKWQGTSNEHTRDAARMVWGL